MFVNLSCIIISRSIIKQKKISILFSLIIVKLFSNFFFNIYVLIKLNFMAQRMCNNLAFKHDDKFWNYLLNVIWAWLNVKMHNSFGSIIFIKINLYREKHKPSSQSTKYKAYQINTKLLTKLQLNHSWMNEIVCFLKYTWF